MIRNKKVIVVKDGLVVVYVSWTLNKIKRSQLKARVNRLFLGRHAPSLAASSLSFRITKHKAHTNVILSSLLGTLIGSLCCPSVCLSRPFISGKGGGIQVKLKPYTQFYSHKLLS